MSAMTSRILDRLLKTPLRGPSVRENQTSLTGGFPSQWTSNTEVFQCHDIITIADGKVRIMQRFIYIYIYIYTYIYSQTFDISNTLVGNEIVDLSDVDGASPVGAAPTTSSFST